MLSNEHDVDEDVDDDVDDVVDVVDDVVDVFDDVVDDDELVDNECNFDAFIVDESWSFSNCEPFFKLTASLCDSSTELEQLAALS